MDKQELTKERAEKIKELRVRVREINQLKTKSRKIDRELNGHHPS